MKKYFLMLCVALTFVACGKDEAPERIYLANLTGDAVRELFLLDGEPFSGVVFNNSETVSIEMRDGIPVEESLMLYHANGHVLADTKNMKFFDAEGQEIDEAQLEKDYADFVNTALSEFGAEITVIAEQATARLAESQLVDSAELSALDAAQASDAEFLMVE